MEKRKKKHRRTRGNINEHTSENLVTTFTTNYNKIKKVTIINKRNKMK